MTATTDTQRAVSLVDGLAVVGERPASVDAGWIDDLGLRHFHSAGLELRHRLAERGLDVAGTIAAIVEAWLPDGPAGVAVGEVELLLGRLVDELGAWDVATAVAAGALDRLAVAPETHAGALTRVGNLLAIAGDARCIDAWALVAAHAADPADRAFARFRIAVAHVKRLGSDADIVDGAFAAVDAAATQLATTLDRRALEAAVGNLRALVHVRAKQFDAAGGAVREAWNAVETEPTPDDAGDAGRFQQVRSQVLANVAFVAGTSGDWQGAVRLLERGIAIADATGSDAKRMEARCLLGYALWRADRPADARALLLAAHEIGAALGATTQHAQAWKLLAVLADDAGDAAERDSWLERLEHHAHGGAPA